MRGCPRISRGLPAGRCGAVPKQMRGCPNARPHLLPVCPCSKYGASRENPRDRSQIKKDGPPVRSLPSPRFPCAGKPTGLPTHLFPHRPLDSRKKGLARGSGTLAGHRETKARLRCPMSICPTASTSAGWDARRPRRRPCVFGRCSSAGGGARARPGRAPPAEGVFLVGSSSVRPTTPLSDPTFPEDPPWDTRAPRPTS
jgi:hypothetical protein